VRSWRLALFRVIRPGSRHAEIRSGVISTPQAEVTTDAGRGTPQVLVAVGQRPRLAKASLFAGDTATQPERARSVGCRWGPLAKNSPKLYHRLSTTHRVRVNSNEFRDCPHREVHADSRGSLPHFWLILLATFRWRQTSEIWLVAAKVDQPGDRPTKMPGDFFAKQDPQRRVAQLQEDFEPLLIHGTMRLRGCQTSG